MVQRFSLVVRGKVQGYLNSQLVKILSNDLSRLPSIHNHHVVVVVRGDNDTADRYFVVKSVNIGTNSVNCIETDAYCLVSVFSHNTKYFISKNVFNSSQNEVNIFIDFEFTGLHNGTTAISFGAVSDYNVDTFYGKFEDYEQKQIDEWVDKNVLPNVKNGNYVAEKIIVSKDFTGTSGDFDEVGEMFICWLNEHYEGYTINFIADVSYYDAVLLFDMINAGSKTVEPKFKYMPVCDDMNTYIANYTMMSIAEAFDINRESLLEKIWGSEIDKNVQYDVIQRITNNTALKHNSLYDAYVSYIIAALLSLV